MNYRTATVLAASDLGEAGTKIIDLNLKDPISRLTLRWQVTKSKHGMDAAPYKDITKIELVDGSDVLFSMDGGEAQALAIYDRRCPSLSNGDYLSGDYQQSLFPIDFGRFLYDPELAFDPTKFRNPQLKVTWDEDVSDTGVGANNLEVLAECFDERIVSPVGFLMSKEHWSSAVTSAGYEYIDLPTDYPIRKMLIKAFATATACFNIINKARIDEENEKRIPFDYDSMENYVFMMKGVWAAIEEDFFAQVDTAGADYFFVTPSGYSVQVVMTPFGDDYVYFEGVESGGRVRPYSHTNDRQVRGIVRGYLPNHCIEFPFGDQKDLADWYDVTKLGSLRLRLNKAGVASSTGAVVLQQLRSY